jgi:hypothetical protein
VIPGLSRAAIAVASLAFVGIAHAEGESTPGAQTSLSVVAKPTTTSLSPDAEALFQRARALHREKKWSEARDAYDRAWQIQKSFQVAANLALVELRLGRARDAAEHLSFALAHLPPNDPKIDEAKTHLEQMLKEATAQVGTLELTVDRQRATIFIDGSPVGSAPLGNPIYVETGRHVLHVEPDGNAPRITRELKVQPGVVYQVTLSSTPAAQSVGSAVATPVEATSEHLPGAPPPVADTKSSPLDARLVVLASEVALTLGAVAFGTVYTLKANASSRNADDLVRRINATGDPQRVQQGSMCDPSYAARPLECDDLSYEVDSANVFTHAARGGFITAGVLASGTIATFLLWPSRRSAPTDKPRITASVTPQAQLVGVAGSF